MPPPFPPPVLWPWIRFTRRAVRQAQEIVEREIYDYGLWGEHSPEAERRMREVLADLVQKLVERN